MAAVVQSPLASSLEKTYGNKLTRLLIDGGTTVLRNIFDHHHPPANLASDLNANYSILNRLFHRRVLNGHQWEKLFPPGGGIPDSKTFDITLLFLLLTNICGLSPPLSGWRAKPTPGDNTLEANLTRVKFYQNELFSHMTSTGVGVQTFWSLWQEVSTTLHSLGLDQAEIDRLWAERGLEEEYLNLLRESAEREETIKILLKDSHQSQAIAEITIKELHQKQLELRKSLQDNNSKLEELSNTLRKTQCVADEAVKMEPKGHQEMTVSHVHQKSMSHLEGLVIKSQSKTQQKINELRESVQQVKHEIKTLKKRKNEQTDETTPVEFFGVPLNDQELLDADPWYVLGACKRFISPGTYEEHFTHLTSGYRTPKQVLRSLLEILAGLDSKDQDECLEAIIHALREASEEGFSHVIERLQKGRQMVSLPLTEKREVIPKVSERVGSSWKSLARDFKFEDEIINSLAGEERGDIQRCYIVLQRWCKYNGRNATVRKLMIALTKMGKAEVNNDIMRCLDPVKPYVVDTSVTNAFQPKMLRSKL